LTDRKQQVTTFTYDAMNRLTKVVDADASTTTYAYDVGNRLRKVVDSVSGTVTLEYDGLDRLTEVSSPQGTIRYAHDAAGRRTSMAVQGQLPVTYGYDDADRLTEIAQGAAVVSVDYDAAGRPTRLTLPADVVAEYEYDAASRLTGIRYVREGSLLGDLTYEYDSAGNCIRSGGSFALTLVPEPTASLIYDEANRLTLAETGPLTHDENGNLTSDGVHSYTWDARDRLTTINGLGIEASFGYDAFGRRIRKTINGVTTEFVHDGANVVHELSGGTIVANVLTGLGIDKRLVRVASDGSRSVLVDVLGSTVALVDETGVVQTTYAYEPFGNTTATGVPSTNPFQFTGRENDATGLYFHRARYYDPRRQRFVSEDPIGFAGNNVNLYAYAFNRPTRWRDPLGLQIDVETIADCLDTLQRIRERPTSGRKDKVEELEEGVKQLNRDTWNIIECLSPVPFIGAVKGKGEAGYGEIVQSGDLIDVPPSHTGKPPIIDISSTLPTPPDGFDWQRPPRPGESLRDFLRAVKLIKRPPRGPGNDRF
jgi:RHS repeat-associated protein